MPEVTPRLVHLIWLGSEVPDRVRRLEADIAAHDPHVEVRVWQDGDLDWLEHLDLLHREARFPAKADIARYEILLRFGGIYLDADFRVHRPLTDVYRAIDEHGIVVARQSRIVYNNAFIGAIPGHPLIADLVAGLADAYRWTGRMTAPATTGPHYLTERLLRHVRRGGAAFELPQHAVFPWYGDEDPLPRAVMPDSIIMSHEWASMGERWSWTSLDSDQESVPVPDRRSRQRRSGSDLRARAAARPSVHAGVARLETWRSATSLRVHATADQRALDRTDAVLEGSMVGLVRRHLRGSASFLDVHPASDLPFLAAGRVLDRPGTALLVDAADGLGRDAAWHDPSIRCSMHVIGSDASDPDRIASASAEGSPLIGRVISRDAPPLGWQGDLGAESIANIVGALPRFDLARVDARRLTPEVAATLGRMVTQRRIARFIVTVDPGSVDTGIEVARDLLGGLERHGHTLSIGPWLVDGRGRTWREHLRVAARPFQITVTA